MCFLSFFHLLNLFDWLFGTNKLFYVIVRSNAEEKDTLEGEEELCAFSKDLLETVGSLIREGSALVENEIRAAMLTNIRDNPKFKVILKIILFIFL